MWSASATGDVTGDGVVDTTVLLYCSPQPSNFFVEEVHVLGPDGKLITTLPSPATLDPGGILPPEYVPEEFSISDGQLTTGMRFYGPDDSHASGPSQHRTIVWQWNGNAFTAAG